MRSLTILATALLLSACGDAAETTDTADTGDTGTAGDSVVDEAEVPDVGWTAELENFSHGVGGTAVILDERTIELRDFTFDGGGVDARLFLVVDGADFNEDIELSDNLVGTAFTGETFTVTIPDGVSFEDWNLITLWCIPFSTAFGAGVFLPPQEG